MSARFPWDDFMAVGLGRLRLAPAAFWAATPREIAAAMPHAGAAPPRRADIAALMQRFPDET